MNPGPQSRTNFGRSASSWPPLPEVPRQPPFRNRELSAFRRFRVLKSSLGLRPVFHWTESRVRGHIAVCVLAAVIEQLIGNRLRDADLRDPDLDEQHLSAERAIQELDRIRQVTFTAGAQTITAVTRRTDLLQQILNGLGVDTAAWTRPVTTG
jgi:transposase